MKNKNFKMLLLSATLLALTACSTAGRNGGGANADGAGVGANGAQASGVNGMSNFAGDNDNVGAMQVGNQTYYFDFDQSNVPDGDLASIKVQADYLNSHPNAKILLAGDTDERGSREYNIGLGQRRADSIAAALAADGVSSKQITTVSYGAEKPAAFGHDESSWTKNRRADLTYTQGKDG